MTTIKRHIFLFSRFILPILTILLIFAYVAPQLFTTSIPRFMVNDEATQIFEVWSGCVRRDMTQLRSIDSNAFLSQIPDVVRRCESTPTIVEKLRIMSFTNNDETKYSLLPVRRDAEMTIVTLGVGQDIKAEKDLKAALQTNHIAFYGADPIVDVNADLYATIGKFYPFAVSKLSQMDNSSVLLNGRYVDKNVIHIELIIFLKEIIQKTFIDNMFIDAEGAEYDLMDYFVSGGRLDAQQIVVCQFNMEIHQPTQVQKARIQRFLVQMFDDRRYAFFRPVLGNHLRLFFINFSDSNCRAKFFG